MKRAFTLIELLVVIAIIAILAAILFPVFAQAKEAARKTADLSNNKQLLTSVHLYLADSDDVFPMLRNSAPDWHSPVVRPQVRSGHIVMEPYVKNRDIWLSPNDSVERCDSTSNGFHDPKNKNNWTGGGVSYVFTYNRPALAHAYGISGWDSTPAGTTNNHANWSPSLSGSGVQAHASTIYLVPNYIAWSYWNGLMQHRADQREYAFPDAGGTFQPTWPQTLNCVNCWCTGSNRMAIGAYSGITNWGFADGHSKAMRRDQIMDRMWVTDPAQARDTNKRNLIHFEDRYK
jgi:prepilin-type N-terminal cleavage/methylation domain-containing protein